MTTFLVKKKSVPDVARNSKKAPTIAGTVVEAIKNPSVGPNVNEGV